MLRLSPYILPAAEPMHLTEAKLHLRLAVDAADAEDYDMEDDLLTAMISATRQVAETETWKSLVLQVWDLWLDGWPDAREIEIPLPPLRQVDFIKYTDSNGVVTTWDPVYYEVDTDSNRGRIVLGYGRVWPWVTLQPKNPIQIRFRCGYLVPFTADATANTLTALNHPFADADRVRLSVSGGVLPTGLSTLTDYFVRDVSGDTLKLAATVDGVAIDLTTAGTGNMFIGVIPAATVAGMKLVLTDLYQFRSDTIIEQRIAPFSLPRAASHLFAMDSARSV